MFEIQMEYIPGNDQIWVARLSPDDPIYQYPTLMEAEAKAFELESADPTPRKYRIVEI